MKVGRKQSRLNMSKGHVNVVVEGFVAGIEPTEKALRKFNNYVPGKGMRVLRFSDSGSSPKERIFRITEDGRHLIYTRSWKSLWRTVYLPFEDILSIQPGQHVKNFHLYPEYMACKSTSLALVYKKGKGSPKAVAVTCVDADQYGYFFGTILGILEKIKETRASTTKEMRYLQRLWIDADEDNKGRLNFQKIKKILQQCNIDMPTKLIEAKFKKVDLDQSNNLDFNEFVFFVDLLNSRPELRYIWARLMYNEPINMIAKPGDDSANSNDPGALQPFPLENVDKVDEQTFKSSISLKEFHQFLQDVQRQKGSDGNPITLEETQERLRSALAKTGGEGTKSFDGKTADYEAFKSFMKSEHNTVFDEANKGKLYHDMTQPLSQYYIASSHNTYLEGDQLASASSTQRYITDVLEGCRCVELDCWDGANNEPIITHGHTACSTITFRDAISAINEYGFATSPYPIILSIEQHCSLEQQKVQVDIMKDTFKEKLATRMTNSGEQGVALPSPEDLKYKILVKGKREDDDGDGDEEDEGEEEDDGAAAPSENAPAVAKDTSSKKKDRSKKTKVHPEMTEITYLGTGKVKKFDADTLRLPCDMMCSYSETTTLKNLQQEDKKEGWVLHNRGHLSRIYPKGLRINSSNYLPTPAWCVGNQLVALNYQTGDEAMFINRAKFRENAQCGYLLKPEWQRRDGGAPEKALRLYVHVLGGGNLPKPGGESTGEIIDPYVIVSVDGHPDDKEEKSTAVIDNNGFDPMWNTVFDFTITQPSQAFLSFQVRDDDSLGSDFVAQSCSAVTCLQEGLRNVPLSDRDGTCSGPFQFASLFVNLKIQYL